MVKVVWKIGKKQEWIKMDKNRIWNKIEHTPKGPAHYVYTFWKEIQALLNWAETEKDLPLKSNKTVVYACVVVHLITK